MVDHNDPQTDRTWALLKRVADEATVVPDVQVERALLEEYRFITDMSTHVFQEAPDAIIVADDGGIIRMVNTSAEYLFGYHSSQLRGQPVEVLIPIERRTGHVPLRDAYVESPRKRPMEVGFNLMGQHRSGRLLKLDINLAPVMTPRGVFIIATIRTFGESSHGAGDGPG